MDTLRTDRFASSFSTRYLFVFLILFGSFAIFFNLGGRAVENKDYLRYAEIAREILEFKDWTMLRNQGEIYVDKPPLHFWLIAGTYKILGVTPFAARIPSAMAALAGILTVFFLAILCTLAGPEPDLIGYLVALVVLSAGCFLQRPADPKCRPVYRGGLCNRSASLLSGEFSNRLRVLPVEPESLPGICLSLSILLGLCTTFQTRGTKACLFTSGIILYLLQNCSPDISEFQLNP